MPFNVVTFLSGSLITNLVILFFLYGAGQSASAIEAWEEKYRRKRKIIH